jgi:hypothetical protein
MGKGRCTYRVLVRKPEGRRKLGRPRHRWQDNVKMDVRAWTGSIWLRIGTGGRRLALVNAEPLGFIKCGEFLD